MYKLCLSGFLSAALACVPVAAGANYLYFSWDSDHEEAAVPGVCDLGSCDPADIYLWSGAAGFSLYFDASAAGLPSGSDIDALYVADDATFYASFAADDGAGPLLNGLAQAVRDEDVYRYDANSSSWSLYFDGSMAGLDVEDDSNRPQRTIARDDLDAFDILSDTTVVVSSRSSGEVTGASGESIAYDDSDLLRCEHQAQGASINIEECIWSIYFDGESVDLSDAGSEDVHGASVEGEVLYLSTVGTFVADLGGTVLSGDGGDVFTCTQLQGAGDGCTAGAVFFDGGAHGLVGRIDAVHAGTTVPPSSASAAHEVPGPNTLVLLAAALLALPLVSGGRGTTA